jgi:hypothetical protein
MRKLIVGLLAVGLLAVAAPAMAQIRFDTGMGDPLGLIASGAVLPYFGTKSSEPGAANAISPGSQSFLEVTSPVGGNSNFHMFFFSAACVRQQRSVGLPLTVNDVEIIRIDNADPANQILAPDGLIAAAGSSLSGQSLQPLNSPIHARVYWVTAEGFIRTLEPISLDHAEFPSNTLSWNPLRTGASFFAPLEDTILKTTLYLICPTLSITSKAAAASNTSVFPSPTFPVLEPQPPVGATSLQARVYDDEEGFLRNFTFTCTCLTGVGVTALDAVYADPVNAPFGTYTEIETRVPPNGPFSFTGYRAIHVGGSNTAGGLEAFGRLDNANFNNQQGFGPQGSLTERER